MFNKEMMQFSLESELKSSEVSWADAKKRKRKWTVCYCKNFPFWNKCATYLTNSPRLSWTANFLLLSALNAKESKPKTKLYDDDDDHDGTICPSHSSVSSVRESQQSSHTALVLAVFQEHLTKLSFSQSVSQSITVRSGVFLGFGQHFLPHVFSWSVRFVRSPPARLVNRSDRQTNRLSLRRASPFLTLFLLFFKRSWQVFKILQTVKNVVKKC